MKKRNIIKFLLTSSILSLSFSVLPSSYAAEKICDLTGICYEYETEESEPHIHLISNWHIGEGKEFETILAKEAFNKKFVYAQESIVRDAAVEKRYAQNFDYDASGFFFGIEGEMADVFMDFAYCYSVPIDACIKGSLIHSEEADGGILESLLGAHIKPLIRKVLLSFFKSNKFDGINSSLVSDVRKFVSKKSILDQNMLKEAKNLQKKYSYEQWTKFFQAVSVHMLDNYIVNLPKDERPNIEKTRAALLNPGDDKSVFYVRFKLNVDWRNSFMKKNIDEIYEFAKTQKKPLFILVGIDHFEDLESHLKEAGYPLKSYPHPLESIFNRAQAEKYMIKQGLQDEL